MPRLIRLCLVVVSALLAVIVLGNLLVYPATARPSSTCDPDVQLSNGAWVRICMPSGPDTPWNGDLVVYAHGYVAFNKPITIPEDQLQLPGTTLPQLINFLGYAFATTSYRTNGLAVETGVDDLVDVVNVFSATHGVPTHTLLTGVSEGGLITTLAIEQRPDVFNGGLAGCGPIGDFGQQINYFGDFRVLFDYFFPHLLSDTNPISIPQWLIDDWPYYYTATIQPVIFDPANAYTLNQLLRVSHAPYITGLITTINTSVLDALSYNVMATNDAVDKLGGQPFDNHDRVYAGSADDVRLNAAVQRFTATQTALNTIDAIYQTTGLLTVPLVTLHTTLDQQVPYWHEQLYRVKVIQRDSLAFHQPRIGENPYGHCNFSTNDALGAFGQLVTMVYSPTARYPSPRQYVPMISH